MSDPDRLAELREYLDALYGENVAGPNDLIDVKIEVLDWLVGEVERLRGLLAHLEWAGIFRDAMDNLDQSACPVCEVQSPGPHQSDCWLAAELGR